VELADIHSLSGTEIRKVLDDLGLNEDVVLSALLSNVVYVYIKRKNKISLEDKILCIK